MKLEGSLSHPALSALFTTLADKRLLGILHVTSPMGEKAFGLGLNEIAVHSDPLSEHMRLGDLLVARGRLSEEDLAKFLKRQKTIVPPPLLGELLVKQGLVKPQDIQEVVKFRIEEELYDLFTWRDGTYVFDGERGLDEWSAAGVPDGAPLHRLAVEPFPLFKDALKRLEEWRPLAERLPSPYICFKSTEKGQAQYAGASASAKKLLKLVRESRTLENVVKLSGQGRITVCKAVVRYLDDAWIIPCPASELRFLASEHRSRGRHTDVLHIYRRLLDSVSSDTDREELEQQIDTVSEELKKARREEGKIEGGALARHRVALESYRRRLLVRRVVLVLAGLGGIAYTLWWWRSTGVREPPTGVYLRRIEETEKALAEGRVKEALEIWAAFYEAFPFKESPSAVQARERLVWLTRSFNRQVEVHVAEALLLDRNGKEAEAEAAYLKLKQEYADHPALEPVGPALERLQARKAERRLQENLGVWRLALLKARELEKGKLYERAREEFTKVRDGAPVQSDLRREAQDGLTRLEAVAARVRAGLAAAAGALQAGKAEKALDAYQAATSEWPELDACQQAAGALDELRKRAKSFREALVAARAFEDRGLLKEAAEAYGKVVGNFADFEEAAALQPRVQGLDATLQAAEDLLKQAQEALRTNRKDDARRAYAELLNHHRGLLANRKIKLPTTIVSAPPGCEVTINGKPAGRTPLRTELPVDEALAIVFTRPGHKTVEHAIQAVRAEDMEISVRLERAPVRSVDLPGPALAAPLVLDGRLYVAAGTVLTAFERGAGKVLWTSPRLLDDQAGQRANSNGSDVPMLVSDKTWWSLREPPGRYEADGLLLSTRARDVLVLQTADGTFRPLLKLATEPVGAVWYERSAMLAGKALLAAATAQGRIQVFDLAKPKAVKWEAPLDDAPYPRCTPAGGVLAAGPGVIAAASVSGVVSAWTLAEGEKRWKLELGRTLSFARGVQQEGQGGREWWGVFITGQGGVLLADLAAGRKAWELPAERPSLRAASVGLGPQAVYVHCVEGALRCLPLRPAGALAPLWEAALDDQGVVPLASGEKVFAATNSGYVYALSAADGKVLWRLRCAGVPTHLAYDQGLLYVTLAEGKLVVLDAE